VGLALLTLLLAFAVGRLSGGRPCGLAERRIAVPHLLVAAFTVQAVEPLLSPAVPQSYPLALAVSGTLLAQFVVRNATIPGVPLAGLGLLLNASVVLVNGAMPVSLEAASRSGVPIERLDIADDARHERLDAETRLAPLADIVPTPIPGHREVTSVGDILVAAGIGLFVFSGIRTPKPGDTVSCSGRLDPRPVTATRPPAGRTRSWPAAAAPARPDAAGPPSSPRPDPPAR
jgi:Family of unknown function (DUF5317)